MGHQGLVQCAIWGHMVPQLLPRCYKWLECMTDWLTDWLREIDDQKRSGSPNGPVRIHEADGDCTKLDVRFVIN
jgi:hypothetical protein